MSKPLISVILGSYNQKEVLKKVLDSFSEQTLPLKLFEVIVVDSSSTDGTQEFLKEYQASYLFNPIIQENKGKTAARNRGVSEAKSELIFITDSDMIAHPDLLKEHVEAQKKAAVPTCFEGVTFNLKSLEWPTTQDNLDAYIQRDYKSGAKLGWFYFLTGNISFPKALFDEEGGFDETFLGYGWEDLELGYRLSRKKKPLVYLKEAMNYHYHVLTKDEEIERNVKKGESAKVLLQLHPELKWFLGLNPLSCWLFPKIKKGGYFYRFIEQKCYQSTGLKHRFGFWFLKEHHYLTGILSER